MQATGNTRNPVRHIAALSALLAAAGCASAQAATPITFITNWYAQAEHGGFYQALADGLYAEKGLDVSIRMGGPQVNSAQLLAAGQAQCIIKDDIGTVMARQQGIPLTMVGASFQYDPTVLAELDGRKVLISSSAHSSWWPWAKSQYGFTDAMSRPYTFNVQPFIADNSLAQQGYMSSEPFALQREGVEFNVFSLGQEGYPPYGNSIACSDELIEQHPEQVQAFLDASREGWKRYITDPSGGNAVIQQENPDMTTEQLAFALERLRSSGMVAGGDAATQGIGVITDARMQTTWNMLLENQLVDSDKVALQDVYTTEFITQNPVLP